MRIEGREKVLNFCKLHGRKPRQKTKSEANLYCQAQYWEKRDPEFKSKLDQFRSKRKGPQNSIRDDHYLIALAEGLMDSGGSGFF